MPSNKNALIRYKFLDEMLSDRYHKYTCEDLLIQVNKRLSGAGFPMIGGEQSDYNRYIRNGKRVIQMDLKALQEAPFNMEIDSSRRLYGAPVYRYADQSRSLFSKPLSNDEKYLLHEVLSTLGQFSGLDNLEWIQDLQEKLNDHHAFGGSEYEQGKPSYRKIISFSSNEFLMGREHLAPLFSMISNHKVLDVTYQPFNTARRVFRVYPYLLKQYNDRWYLICTPLASEYYPYNKDFFLNLALDRICNFNVVEDETYLDCNDDIEERYEEIIGVSFYMEKPVTTILMAVSNTSINYVISKPFHGSQHRPTKEEQKQLHQQYPGFDNYTFIKIEVRPNRELFQRIYAYGQSVILLSPDDLRQDMVQEISHLLEKLKEKKYC